MKYDPVIFTPVIAAARRRLPRHWRAGRGEAKKVANNYVAEGQLIGGPNWGNRKGAGAPPANDNAARSPADLRRLIAYCRKVSRSARQLLAARRRERPAR